MEERQGPHLHVVEGSGEESVEQLEAAAMRDLMEVAALWADRLPTGSVWYDACVETQKACAVALRQRNLLLRSPGGRSAG